MRGVIVFFFLFLLVPVSYGIGLSSEPLEKPIYFEPGESYSIDYKISAYSDNASVTVRDPYDDPVKMARFARVGDVRTTDGVKYFTLHIAFPQNATVSEGGKHGIIIGVRDLKQSGGQFSATTAVEKFIEIWVLYKEKVMEAKLVTPSLNVNESGDFKIELMSWSRQDIHSVEGEVKISGPGGEVLDTFETDTVSLPSGERKTLSIPFSSRGYEAGRYHASGRFVWDDNVTTRQSSFNIGEENLDVLNYTRTLVADEITQFSLRVKSGWNDPMEHVYAIVRIDGREVMKTPGTELEPWETVKLQNFLDATGISPGEHEMEIELHFDGNKEVIQDTVTVKAGEKEASLSSPKGIGNQGLVVILAVALAIMIFINIYWMSRKR